jgi:hypothetical protein
MNQSLRLMDMKSVRAVDISLNLRRNMGMEKEKVKIVDAEIVDAPSQEQTTRCELVFGIDLKGSIYFRIAGPDQSLITMSGLMDYAEREMDRFWENALAASSKSTT